MRVFSSVVGHISPELFEVVPGTEAGDKATFISLMVKAPYPDLVESAVEVTASDGEDIIVHGDWTCVVKICDLLRSWISEYADIELRGVGTHNRFQDLDVKREDRTVSPISIDRVQYQSSGQILFPVSTASNIDSSEVKEEQYEHNDEQPNREISKKKSSQACPEMRDQGIPEDTFTLSAARPHGRPGRKGKHLVKTKATPSRRAKSRASLCNQALMQCETSEADVLQPVSVSDSEKNPETDLSEGSNQSINNAMELHREKMTFVDGQGYTCRECGRSSASERNLLEHIARLHGEKNLQCRLCTKAYALPKDLQVHMAVHRKRFACEICQKRFATKYLMLGHRKRRHDNPRKKKENLKEEADAYACKHCSYIGKKLKHLLDHEQRIHGERKFCCPVCDKSYAVSKELKQHMRTHSDQFCCEVCGRVLKSKYALKLHTDIQHRGIPRKVPTKTHLCTLCGLMFPNKTKYVIHQNKVHLNLRPFSCEVCGVAFFSKTSLKDHLKVHEDRRDYSCELCGKSFKIRQNLKMHMVIHADQRPYKCEVCNKTFTQNAALKRHARIHTGERPFQCHVCSASFNDYSILTRHMQGIHRIDHYKFDKDKNWQPPCKDGVEVDGAAVLSGRMKPFKCYLCNRSFIHDTSLKRHTNMHHQGLEGMHSNDDGYAAHDQVLSEAANKVAIALNTLSQELPTAKTVANQLYSQQPINSVPTMAPDATGTAAAQSDLSSSPQRSFPGTLPSSGQQVTPDHSGQQWAAPLQQPVAFLVDGAYVSPGAFSHHDSYPPE